MKDKKTDRQLEDRWKQPAHSTPAESTTCPCVLLLSRGEERLGIDSFLAPFFLHAVSI